MTKSRDSPSVVLPRSTSAVDHHPLIINGLSIHRLYCSCQVGRKHFEMFRKVARLCSSVKFQCTLPFSPTSKLNLLIRLFFPLQDPHSLPILFRLQAKLWIFFLWIIRIPIPTMPFPFIHPLHPVLASQSILLLVRPVHYCLFTVFRISTHTIASRRVPAHEEEYACRQSQDHDINAPSDISRKGRAKFRGCR
jgi:hypothetical protein